MFNPDRKDIQGLLASGYPKMQSSAFLILKFTDSVKACQWLGGLVPSITPAIKPSHEAPAPRHNINVAFTIHGLEALGLSQEARNSFPTEFQLGMQERKQILGDTETSAPDYWEAPFKDEASVHALLMLYAKEEQDLGNLIAQQEKAMPPGVQCLACLKTSVRSHDREHFGFKDGISQPSIKGLHEDRDQDLLETGEFILGYPNHQGELPASPTVTDDEDVKHVLAASKEPGAAREKDLGQNGSYLVFRKLYQDVAHFIKMMGDLATQIPAAMVPSYFPGTPEEWLKAKVVGRFPNGFPLSLYDEAAAKVVPPVHQTAQIPDNSFGYKATDPEGMKCPFGSHVRRSNPRDVLPSALDDSKAIVDNHRILRRGRSYGPLYDASKPESKDVDRGLFFVALCTNICRQFEFIQQTWINNAKFGGLFDNVDCLSGNNPDPTHWNPPLPRPVPDEPTNIMTLPGAPGRARICGFERFVRVKGGAYFFMPGIKALQFLANLPGLPVAKNASPM